jgi:hypothetical protein
MNAMNGIPAVDLRLRDYMDSAEGWGRPDGRVTHQRLVEFVEKHPGVMIFRVSLANVRRVDISFASETVVELARRYRGNKGFCLIGLTDPDQRENWEAAAQRAKHPIMSLNEQGQLEILGVEPTPGNSDALKFALGKPETRAAEYAASKDGVSITNASTKFKQLWEQGFLLRREAVAESGGVEFAYFRVQ